MSSRELISLNPSPSQALFLRTAALEGTEDPERVERTLERPVPISTPSDRGESQHYKNVSSATYKLIFSRLSIPDLKIARLVCQHWHREIFSILEQRSVFHFIGTDNPSDLTRARNLSTFLNVVPKDSFQWKMLKALYSKPEEALPVPIRIQWSTLRITGANFLELKQWVARVHTPNVSHLQLTNVRMNWTKYLLLFRELENLSKFEDNSTSTESWIWEEFEKGCAPHEKLSSTSSFASQLGTYCLSLKLAEVSFHAKRLKEIGIRRARLEEIVLFLKLFLLMECCALEKVSLSAEDLGMGWSRGRKKNARYSRSRLHENKSILFTHLGGLLERNGECTELKLSFRYSNAHSCFEQYTKEKYGDVDGNEYKPDLRDFIVFMKRHRWDELPLKKLKVLVLEFENKKIPTVEEVEYFTTFLLSLSSLQQLSLSNLLLTYYNSLSLPLFLRRIEPLLSKGTRVGLGATLQGSDLEGHSPEKWRSRLPSNLDLFYSHLVSLIVICSESEMDVRAAIFPRGWDRQSGKIRSMGKTTSPATPFLQDFWMIDERPKKGFSLPLFHISEVVESYPNLGTLILVDSVCGLKCCEEDLARWPILDDHGLQTILKGLPKLKHLEVKGNLFFLGDVGVTGMDQGRLEQLKDATWEEVVKPQEQKQNQNSSAGMEVTRGVFDVNMNSAEGDEGGMAEDEALPSIQLYCTTGPSFKNAKGKC